MASLTDLIPIPADINRGLTSARQATMLALLGNPRSSYDRDCRPVLNPRLKALIELRDVGPFRVQGLRPAVDSLQAVLADIRVQQPDVFAVLGTAGMLCARLVRGSATSISNHSWGTAIDLTIDADLDAPGNGRVQRGLALIAPIFNRHGWFWGAGFPREDGMHFECSEELIRSWHAEGGLSNSAMAVVPDLLSLGDRGAEVEALQTLLNRCGAQLEVDGDFGRATHAALMAFQADHELRVDGVAGPKTIAALREAAREHELA